MDKTALAEHARRWHGFRDHVDALKALAWMITGAYAAVVLALDDRYAPKSVEEIAEATWEITVLREIEEVQYRLCTLSENVRGASAGWDRVLREYMRELNTRLAILVSQYREHKDGATPFIPNCPQVKATNGSGRPGGSGNGGGNG